MRGYLEKKVEITREVKRRNRRERRENAAGERRTERNVGRGRTIE